MPARACHGLVRNFYEMFKEISLLLSLLFSQDDLSWERTALKIPNLRAEESIVSKYQNIAT
jgi:hypothetical protein